MYKICSLKPKQVPKRNIFIKPADTLGKIEQAFRHLMSSLLFIIFESVSKFFVFQVF